MVEQRTENPCVPGSIPGGTTKVGDYITVIAYLFNKIYNSYLLLLIAINLVRLNLRINHLCRLALFFRISALFVEAPEP